MDNSKAAEDNPPSQDTLATSEAPFPTPRELRCSPTKGGSRSSPLPPLNRSAHILVVPGTLSDISSQSPKPRKMDNSKAAEDNPPSQDTLATSKGPFSTP
ncbi:hypothetical protein A6R68_15844, partial [Neotoma lepida]